MSQNPKEKHSDPTGSQRTSWRVLWVATISLCGILLLAKGNLELSNAPTNPCYHHIDAAYDCSMYCQLSNPFVSAQVNKLQHAVPVQQRYKTTAGLEKYHSPLDGHLYKDSEA